MTGLMCLHTVLYSSTNHAHINLAGKDAGSGCCTSLPADLRQPLVWKLADPALIKTAAMHNHTVFIIYFRFVLSKPNPAEQRRTFDFTILPLPLVLFVVVCKSVIPGSMLHTQ